MADRSILIQGLIELHLAGKGGEEAVASMTKIIAQAKQVEAATGGIGAGTKKATEGVNALDKAFGSLGRTVAGYFAAGAIANFLRDSFLGFARTERQALALEQQIRALGGAAGDSGVREFIAQTSQAFGILDDDLVPALQRALLGFKNLATAEEVVTIASKFAANGIGDVGTNVERITRFFQTGSAKALVDFGINVKGGEEATLDLNEGIKLLLDTAAGMPATFDDAQASINRWRNDIDAAKDAIGKLEAGLIRAIEKAGTFAGEALDTVFNPENIRKNAEGQQLILDLAAQADKKRSDAASSLAAQAAEEQKRRDKKKADEKAKDELKAEQARLEKVAQLTAKTEEDILKQRIALTEAGSKERIAAEIAVNDRVEQEALRSARVIGAKTVDIEKFFASERGRIRSGTGESEAAKDARELAKQLDPRTGFAEVEKFAKEHQEELTKIYEQGIIDRLRVEAELAPDDTEEQRQAKLALERAQLEISTNQKVRAAEKQKDIIGALRAEEAASQLGLIRLADEADRKASEAKLQRDIYSAQQALGALGSLFAKHKAFAIATAIINTALGITAVWKDESLGSWWAKVAATIVVAASGAAQIAAIRSASPGGGGSASAGVASAPTQSASPPQSTVAGQAGSTLDALAGRSGSSGSGGLVINIGTAFGDQQAMTKLGRELDRITRNSQSVLR